MAPNTTGKFVAGPAEREAGELGFSSAAFELQAGAIQLPSPASLANSEGYSNVTVNVTANATSSLPSASPLAYLKNPPTGFALPVGSSNPFGFPGSTATQIQQAIDEQGLTVNGSGVKIGVLSDSFNNLGGAAADEANGALPAAANIQILKDLPSGGTDEGRAMMQIIHDVAPGASLAFYTAFESEQDFANGILALANAGCKVIVDDVGYFDEPFFQNGVIAQAIQTVEARGVTYITAAGNNASNAYQAAWTPISGSFHGTLLTDAESFGGSLVQTIMINTAGTGFDVPLLLEWNQAYGQATSDLEILVFNSGGRLVGTATNATSGEPNNPWVLFDFRQSGTYFVAIENLSGPDPGLIKEIIEGNGLPATISGANVGSIYGHPMTPGAVTVGAVNLIDTPAFGVTPAVSESFSSSGLGTELLFANNGAPLSSPVTLSPVVVSGVDNIQTTLPGGLSDFFGTSAASASLAGVAALLLSANPNLTPSQIEQILESTALPMLNSAVSGAGLLQVNPAVAAAQNVGITVNGATSDAVQGGSPIGLLTATPNIADPTSPTLQSATIKIANASGTAVSGDQLFVNGQQSGTLDGGAIAVSWSSTTDTLTLTGTAFIAAYQTLLSQITYQDAGIDSSSGSHPVRTVTWLVNDGTQTLNTTSHITIDRPPVANNNTGIDLIGASLSVGATSGVLANAIDLDNDPLRVTAVNGQAGNVGVSVTGTYGSLTLNANGSYTYLPGNSAVAGNVDNFSYAVGDANGGTSTAVLNIVLQAAPTLIVHNDPNATPGQQLALSTLVTISDPSNVGYQLLELMDTNGTAAGGQFVVNGVPQTGGHEIDVAPANVANTVYDVGTLGGTDTLSARLLENNGQATAWQTFTVTAPVVPTATPPTLIVHNDPNATPGQQLALSTLVTISDPSNVGYQLLELMDTNGTAAGGQFVVNGVPQTGGHEIDVTPGNVANTVYDVGTGSVNAFGFVGNTIDTLSARLLENNGQLTAWQTFTVTPSGAPTATPPTLTVHNDPNATPGQQLALSTLVTISDPSNVGYQLLELMDTNGTAAGGQFVVNGVSQTGGHEIDVTPANVANTIYDVGTSGGTDTLSARLLENNGQATAWQTFTVTAPVVPTATPPTLIVHNDPNATPGQQLALSTLVTISDPSNVGYQLLELMDTNGTAAGGQFVVNGAPQTGGHEIDVAPANVANTVYDVGTLGGTDTLSARLLENNGQATAWQTFTVTAPVVPTATPPTLIVHNDPNATPGQQLALSTLVTISDPSNVGYQLLELMDTNGTAAGGQFVVNGVPQTGGHEIDVTPGNVANTVYDVGTGSVNAFGFVGNTIDTLSARLLENNGQLTAWQTFTVTAPTALSSILDQAASSDASLALSRDEHTSNSTPAPQTADNRAGTVYMSGPERGFVDDPKLAITNTFDNLGVQTTLSQITAGDGHNANESATPVAVVSPQTVYNFREPASNSQENTAMLSSKLTGLSTADTFVFNLNPSKEALISPNAPQHELALDHTTFANATALEIINQAYDAGHFIPADSHSAATAITTPSPAPQNHLDIFHSS